SASCRRRGRAANARAPCRAGFAGSSTGKPSAPASRRQSAPWCAARAPAGRDGPRPARRTPPFARTFFSFFSKLDVDVQFCRRKLFDNWTQLSNYHPRFLPRQAGLQRSTAVKHIEERRLELDLG